jgi:hypothetical protein
MDVTIKTFEVYTETCWCCYNLTISHGCHVGIVTERRSAVVNTPATYLSGLGFKY